MSFEIMKIGKARSETVVISSLDIAEAFEKNHRDVLKAIRELKCPEEFRLRNFAQSTYVNEQNHKQPMCFVARDGFALLAMGFTGEKAMKFKLEYINRFNEMEKLLQAKLIDCKKGMAVRNSLTKALMMSKENERMHGNAYPTYTNLIYKALFDKSAKELRADFGISSTDNLRDHFSPEELSKIESMERLVSGLIDIGWGYNKIKAFVSENDVKMLT
ncbi:MAG: Rha family transcriptional regulator [Ruminococcaceae bacterium]|nr:Rha family transcriptional regulator [Oscillospiraceae bacterium]